MRRPARSTPHATPRLRWMEPTSPGEQSPMDRLMTWLERNGDEYRASKRKIDLLEQLGEEMATNGIYGLTISSIRSQISRLKNGVQTKAEGGNCASKDVNVYYDRLLGVLFDDEERAAMRERASAAANELEDHEAAARPRVSANLKRLAPIDPILDTAEIRRRFELLSARQGLQSQGVDAETIDSFLPLHRN
ncbi:hypothetical protein PHYSODRAFT_533083 [Phytophthora sojae]|uniref:Uncharacterized protein n=1 Tax=Phytophthora sojae (strain P6497) TaxID=1094619 RepID=G5AER3_PHYSP|nr:hypothetical protein PHYSODRAFT_533083 [Phytophthora sojae]EGZ05703.1 hypothetical protein PHYSODRAFT_533083 [Phytophthora sojae]|eukprot:XP_009538564.1 hypothetical protein PHYSODRAFT_533083 [Phytophthora sojae]